LMLGKSRAISVILVATLIALVGCSISAFRTNANGTFNVRLRGRHQNRGCHDIGNIEIDYEPYKIPTTLAVASGQHALSAGILRGCEFVMWEVEGQLGVSNPNAMETKLTVNGDGTLRVVYRDRGTIETCCPEWRGVGGVVVPTNAYMTLAPYLAVIGLVAVAATVAAKKRRK